MIASLMGQAVSNASLYDGATALAEAVLMACRLKKENKRTGGMVPQSLNPFYRQVLKTILSVRNIALIEEVPCDKHEDERRSIEFIDSGSIVPYVI